MVLTYLHPAYGIPPTSVEQARRCSVSVMLSLCDRTGVMCLPWAEAGYDCYAVDLQHPRGASAHPLHENITAVGMSILDLFPDGLEDAFGMDISFIAAFPPCTNLCVSGSRWWNIKETDRRMQLGLPGGTPVFDEAMDLVHRCREIAGASGARWFIENPVGRIPQRWRPADHIFDPYEYGGYPGGEDDGYTKRTCLWVGGGFVMPERRPIPLDPETHNRIHWASGPNRSDIRSVTPAGFARAVFEFNHEGAPRAAEQLALA